MGKQSSTKKVQRAARAGGGRKVSRRESSMLWPGLISVIVVVGLVLIVVSRSDKQAADMEERPRLAATNPEDHWHEAYGINVCGSYLGNIPEAMSGGIHTHGDGLIHIEAQNSAETGKNANIGKFASNVGNGFRITDTSLRPPGGEQYENGEKCGVKSARVSAFVWDSATDTEPRVVTEDIAKVRLRDQAVFALSFNPPGTKLEKPTSVAELPSQRRDTTGTTVAPEPLPTTTVAGSSDTTTAPTDTTTAPPSTTP